MPARTALLTQDETELLLRPPLRAGWARRGEPTPVPISGQNARRTVFGSLHLRTGHTLLLAQKHKGAENFQAFLTLVHEHYRAWPVALLLDANSCHTAQGSLALAHALGIRLFWLPTGSPHLNPLEHLWRHGKAVVCANPQYPTLEEQVDQFIDTSRAFLPPSVSIRQGCSPATFGLKNGDINFAESLSWRLVFWFVVTSVCFMASQP